MTFPLRTSMFLIAAALAAAGLFAYGWLERDAPDADTTALTSATGPESSSRPSAAPQPRPAAPTQTAMLPVRPSPSISGSGSVAALQAGLSALAGRRIDEARTARDALPADSLDRHILAWAIALYGGNAVPGADIEWTLKNLPAWPGKESLRRSLERAAYREQAVPAASLAMIGDSVPLTLEGAIIAARAKVAAGDRTGAWDMLAPLWRMAAPDTAQEALVMSEFGQVLSVADHRARMETMFYAEQANAALRLATPAQAKELAAAWSAVLRRDANAGKLLDAVPAAQRDAGWLFAKARYLRQINRASDAAALHKQAPADATALVDPEAWWAERRLLARRLLDARKPKLSYEVAASQTAGSPTTVTDAAFHAGWIALRFLKEPQRANPHFTRLAAAGESAITKARAYYWLGRTAEAGGPGKADEFYDKAARYGTTFYGQLAAAKTGKARLNVADPAIMDDDRQRFDGREAVTAIDRLGRAGYPQYAARLYTDLAQQLTSPGELALLAAKAEGANNHFVALRVGKIAMQRGIDVGALSHPVGAIPDAAPMSGAGKALAYAVARQESEFNIGAVSSAGALGLLQLMPDTAKQTAQRIGMEFSAPRLTSDAAYNATLGAEELSRQLDRFSGSYVLTFIAYNAGPKRAEQWIKRYGDPRGRPVEDVVDWIERVPFSETRSYIQRVLENYEVYKMRLTGHADLERDLTDGRTASLPADGGP